MTQKQPQPATSATALKVGAICLVFMILGYEVALFVHHAALERVAANRDHPDTVYITLPPSGEVVSTSGAVRASRSSHHCASLVVPPLTCPRVDTPPGVDTTSPEGGATRKVSASHQGDATRRAAEHSETVMAMREKTRRVESFRFDPNTADAQTLQRLGFTQKQAQAIVNYREKGGRFRRKADFARSFAVADSVYERLAPYIDIPLLDINVADSAAFDALPGIGGYFAAKMVSYRRQLGGYSCTEQLMDIWHFDRGKYDALSDLIFCSPPRDSLRLWTAPADTLRLHPHIRSWQTARSIVLYRQTMPRDAWTVQGLARAGIITDSVALKLGKCAIAAYR